MKKLIISLFKSLIILPIFASGQSSPNSILRKIYKMDNIKIDKVVYYHTPYAIYGNKPNEKDYFPSWYWGYCATSYPLAFKNYVAEANSFMLPPKSFSETQLKSYETKFKSLKLGDYALPYVYCYGEIYLTDEKTKKQYIMLFEYEFEKEIENMEFNKIDIQKFKISKSNRFKNNKNQSDNILQVYDAPTFISFYVLDKDGIYKIGDTSEIINNVIKNNNNNVELEGIRFDYFQDMLKLAPNYIRSYIENGERIFETVKQTPKGIVVIGKKRKQLNEDE